jgi:DNA-binding response OmpR family regulator
MSSKPPKQRILIVEDDQHEALLYREVFENEGYEVQVVNNGDAAIAGVRENPPAAVVLDINMPVRDGIDTLTRLMDLNNQLPVILNTAYSAYKDNFMTWAAVAYVVKSSDLTELKEAVRKAVARIPPEKN